MPKKIFTEEEKQAIIEEYTVLKTSAKKIGEKYGCSNTTILKNLKEWGISPNTKVKNLTGQTFGYLTAIRPAPRRNDRYTRWVCRCQCGNETEVRTDYLTNGHTTSCGCKVHEPSPKQEHLEGMVFGEWTVLERGNKESYWKCRCSCGVEKEVFSNSLKSGKSLSCGHLFKNDIRKPIVGERFGNLVVLDQIKEENGNWYCTCQCDCGNITKVKRQNLTSGNTSSCGCITSKGEAHITRILQEKNISYIPQYHPEDIKSRLKFDFYINNQYIVEFDGPQHYGQISGYYTEETFYNLVQNDYIKNDWCLKHNIPLYRIPYDYRDTLTYETLTDERFRVTCIDHYGLGIPMEEAQDV